MTEPTTIEQQIRQIVREEILIELAKQPAPPKPTEYVSVAAYARARSISVSTVRNAVRAGRLPGLKIGTAVRVRSDAEIGASVTPSTKRQGPSAEQIADRILAARPGLRLVGQH
ncbi:MAG: hypothetical protein QM831_12515 [Kofleriaceae bacterium]